MNLSDTIIIGSVEDLKHQIKQSPEINYLDEYGYTPLIQTIIVDEVEKTKILLTAGADVNQKDITGRTPLHWAVANNKHELIALLVTNGANPNAYTIASEPILAKPILRHDKKLKKLLVKHGAKYTFANDYIHAKLLGHRFELIGSVDILDADGVFTEVDYEGFYLEFSLDLIRDSLLNFSHNFAARPINSWFSYIQTISTALEQAREVLQYDHYLKNPQQQQEATSRLLKNDPLLLPISQEGHAITVVKYKNLLAICDRSLESEPFDCIPIYFINRPSNITVPLIADLLFHKQSIQDIQNTLQKQLSLQAIAQIPLKNQVIGNCSWANVEAIIPSLTLMLQLQSHESPQPPSTAHLIADSLELFHRWRDWDTHRALSAVIQEFESASPARKASIAALLAGVLFQRCSADDPQHIERAKPIIKILKTKGYEYILESYIQFYVYNRSTYVGQNLQRLLHAYELDEVF